MRTFSCPTIVYGDDALAYLHQIPQRKALVVTAKAVVRSGLITRLAHRLDTAGVQWRVFDQIGEAPAVESIDKGGRMAGEYQPDWIIALGDQGCAMAARAIAGRATSSSVEPLPPLGAASGPLNGKAKLIVIPAHIDTDSGATPWPGEEYDSSGGGLNGFAPDVAILDPDMFQQLSPQSLALTGMETLCRAIETYVSPWGSSITDGPALIAARQVFENIINACEDPENMEALMQVQQAVFLAGLFATPAMAGLALGAARVLADTCHLSRRLSAGLILPYAMEFLIHCSIQTTAKYAEIARFCSITGETSLEQSMALAAGVRSCAARIGQPTSIRECILDKARFETSLPDLVGDTLKQASVLSAARVPDRESLAQLFRCAYNGTPLYS